jgi:hypothetical protein
MARCRIDALGTMVLAAAAAGATGACGPAGAERAVVEARDSAGVRIVENLAAPAAPAALGLAVEPDAQIGVVEGAPEYQLDRVQWLTRLTDGTIVVANGGTSEIRFYDAAGRHLRTSGRSGAGPGEYRAITYLRRLAGDTVLVYDAMNRRLTYLDAAGAHVRDVSMAGDQPLRVVAALEDGTLLSTAPRPSRPPANTEFARDTAAYQVVGNDGALPLERHYPGGERRMQLNEQAGSIMAIQIMTLPFARNVFVSASQDAFVIGSNYAYELHVVDAAGVLRTIIRRLDVVPQPVTTDLIDRFVDVQVARQREAGRTVDEAASRRLAQSYHRVEAVPAYERVLAADDGSIWVQDWAPPVAQRAADRWSVFAADGALRGAVDVPYGFRPLYVDADAVIGVIRDDYDVEYVRVYALR